MTDLAADGVWPVGTAPVAAFLFNAAVSIRQQEVQVERMYDRATWRRQTVEERGSGEASRE